MILEVIQRPELLERVRAEIEPYMGTFSLTEPVSIDVDGLCKQTLVQSIYAEVLRVHNGTVLARVPQTNDFAISGWGFPKDEPIMVSTYDTARSPTVWNQGTRGEPHPLGEFWPERFIVDPANPSSGPVLPKHTSADGRQEKLDSGEQHPRFSLDGTNGSWIPYGGGPRMCPGRHFAKKELIVTMAMFLTAFDIELTPREDGGWVKDDKRYFMFGVMHPKGPIPGRIRRRKPVRK